MRIRVVFVYMVFLSLPLLARTLYVDCHGDNGGTGWNNVSIATAGATAVLSDKEGESTGITMTVSNHMTAGTSKVGSKPYSGDAREFAASGDNGAFGSLSTWSGKPPCPKADIVFSGLKVNTAYTFTYFASRKNESTGWVRESEYVLQGTTTESSYLNAADNFSNVAVSTAVYPDASGKIILTIDPGPNNDASAATGNYYFYLNAFKIEYQENVSTKDIIYIDPASSVGYIGSGWNGINFQAENSTLALTTIKDAASGISATVITGLAGRNTDASTSPVKAAAEFAPAGGNSVYGCDETFIGNLASKGIVHFNGLHANVAYTFTMYASRMGSDDIRDAIYTCVGVNTASATLNAAGNNSEVVVISDIYPDSSGEIEFTMTGGPDNNNKHGFFYLTSMKIEYTPVPGARSRIADIYVDVSGSNNGKNWNQIQAIKKGSRASLVTSTGSASGYKIEVIDPYSGTSTDATGARVGDAAEFHPMGTSCVFGNDDSDPQAALRLTGLNPAYLYEFTFFGSRMGAVGNRESLFTCSGVSKSSAVLDTADNLDKVCTISDIQPSAAGVIVINLKKGPNNDKGGGYFYLGAFKITAY